MAILLKAKGSIEEVNVSTLKDIQNLVGGRVEFISEVDFLGEQYSLLVHEEALLFGSPSLNLAAIGLLRNMETGVDWGIVGEAVLATPDEFP